MTFFLLRCGCHGDKANGVVPFAGLLAFSIFSVNLSDGNPLRGQIDYVSI